LKRSAQELADEFRVSRRTLFQDARFAEAVDKLAALGGDAVRQGVLGRTLKWTRRDVERVAKLEASDQERILAEALQNGGRPKVPKSGKRKTIGLTLPLDKPRRQAQILERQLGPEGILRLARALRTLCNRRSIGEMGPELPTVESEPSVPSVSPSTEEVEKES
jgi:hypothetical protein